MNIKTEEAALEAVQENGMLLGDLLEELRTIEVCKAAVAQNGDALQFVPVWIARMGIVWNLG